MPKIATRKHVELLSNIIYPFKRSSTFENDEILFGDKITSFHIIEGGRFISDTDEMIPATLSLFTGLVSYENTDNFPKGKIHENNVMPSIFMKICQWIKGR